MALVDLIFAKKAKDDLLEVQNGLKVVHKQILDLNSLNVDFFKSKAPNTLNQLNTSLEKSEELQRKQAIAVERLAQQEQRLENSRKRLTEQTEKLYNKEVEKLNKANSLYEKVQSKLNALQKEYRDLAVKKELGLSLTSKEEQSYNRLEKSIKKYDTILKGVDASMGKYQRNVGNYSSAFNPLQNSINQLTREMPAFANSVQTGFMAISNNLPIFFDSMGQIIRQNKELQAQGQPTQSVFKQMAGALLSWGTALSVGVTLLTVYGAEIWDSISGSKAREEQLKKEKEALEKKAQAEDEARTKLASYQSEEISRSKILLENAKNIELPYRKRIEYINELKQRYPEYLGHLSNEKLLAGETADAELKLNDALVKRGIAMASQQMIQQEITNSLKNQKWLNDKLTDLENKRLKLAKELNKIDPFTKNEDLQAKYEDLHTQLTNLYYLEGTLKEQYRDKNEVIQNSLKYYLEQYNANAKYIDVVHESTKAIKEKTKATKEEEQSMVNSKRAFEESISALEKQLETISKFDKDGNISNAYGLISGQLGILKTLYKELFSTVIEGEKEIQDSISLTDEQIYEDYYAWLKLKEATDEYIKTISSGQLEKSLNSIGLSSAKMFLDFDENGKSSFDKLLEGADTAKERFAIMFQTIGDVAQETFELLSGSSKAYFEEQYANLEQHYKIDEAFAGNSEEAKAELKRKYDKERRAIQRREAKAQREMALFNIAINTAQGVVSALAMMPPNVPLSIAIGVIGALQASMVASKEIPQFWKGTENAPEGWALTDEKGAEMHTDKHGNIKDFGNNKGARFKYLEKGDKIYTAEKTRQIIDELMFTDSLNYMLNSRGIDYAPVIVNNGLSKEDFSTGINSLKDTINNRKSLTIIYDEKGRRIYEEEQGKISLIKNNRIRRQQYDI